MRNGARRSRGITIITSWRVVQSLGSLVVVIGVVAGCTSLSSAPPPLTPQADCERNNGAWRAVLNFCEHGR